LPLSEIVCAITGQPGDATENNQNKCATV